MMMLRLAVAPDAVAAPDESHRSLSWTAHAAGLYLPPVRVAAIFI